MSDTYLFQTDHGHVLHCHCCNRYEVVFRNTSLRLTPEAFLQLAVETRRVPVDHWEVGSMGVVRLTPSRVAAEVRLLLSRADVQELDELLHGATVMAELGDMLDALLRAEP